MFGKLSILIVFALLSPFIYATGISIDLLSANDELQKAAVIPWGEKDNELKLIPPPGEDSQYDGPMNFYILNSELFIKEHLRKSYLVIDNKNVKNLRRISFTKETGQLILKKPGEKSSPDIISLRKNDSDFVLKTPVIGNIDVSFIQTGVKSLVFLKEDSSGNIHLLAERVDQIQRGKISVERYWIEVDSKLKLKNLSKLPLQKLYHPEKDIFITDSGEIFLIVTNINGLEIYKGGVK
jgi:hypothetical protein